MSKRGRWDSDEEEHAAEQLRRKKPSIKTKIKEKKLQEKQENVKSSETQVTKTPAVRPALRDTQSLVHPCRSIDSYERLNFIDQGTYGLVFRAKCLETKEVYALKQVKFGNEVNKIGFPYTALREINILLSLRHPNIINVREVLVEPGTDKVFMVMEYCENDLKTCMAQNKQSFSIAEVHISS
jgi:cell division cycle 2-like protein